MDLALFKKHVRADDFDGDDDYLEYLLRTAEEVVVGSTRRGMTELLEMGGGDLPLPLQHAVMMLAGHWYNQRESVSGVQMHEVPDTLQVLVKPFVRLVSVEEPGR